MAKLGDVRRTQAVKVLLSQEQHDQLRRYADELGASMAGLAAQWVGERLMAVQQPYELRRMTREFYLELSAAVRDELREALK